jgi:hypothetical protein
MINNVASLGYGGYWDSLKLKQAKLKQKEGIELL